MIQQDVLEIVIYQQLEKDSDLMKVQNMLLDVEEDAKMYPWSMMQSIKLFTENYRICS